MPRDLDFRTRKKPRPVAVASSNQPKPNHLPSLRKAKKKSLRPKIVLWLWAAVIFVVIAVAVFFYYESLKPAPVSQQPKPVSAKTDTAVSASQLGTVTLYNSGAGQDKTDALAKTLRAHKYSVQNLGDSEFQLDQTYIWYQAQYQTDAQTIQGLLGSKKVTLRQYAGTGPYKILVQLGP